MSDPHTIRRMLARRDTAELLEIWDKYDEAEWQPAAFEAIASILEERGELLPERIPKHKYLIHARRIRIARAEDERRRRRCRTALMLAPWLGSVAALIPFFGLLFVADAIYPERLWPNDRDSPIKSALIMGLALGVYVLLWRLCASIIWRVMSGRKEPD